MSHTLSLKLPSVCRAMVLAGLPVLLVTTPAVAWAQNPPAEQGAPPSREAQRGHRHKGPVTPAILRDSIGVTGSRLEEYTKRYNSHMAATQPERDRLHSAMEAIRSSARSGDRSAARERRGALRGQFEALAQRDQQFEANVKGLLSEDQQKRYSEWKEKQREMARKRGHRGHRPDRGGHES